MWETTENCGSALAPAQPKPYATFHRHRYRQMQEITVSRTNFYKS
jgi:hypothetical protein